MKRDPLVRLLLGDDEVFIDGFAGGGGTSTGIEMALGRSPDIAINHDAEALAMHEANHPTTRHIKTNIKNVNWHRLLPKGQRCGAAWFSPDCTFHSKARGGKPFRDRNRARRIRGLVWEMVRCAVAVRPRVLFMENVEEVKDWGPLDTHGRIIQATKGKNWRKVLARLRNLGYTKVEYRELRASPYGAPTLRKRLVMVARCDGQPIVWPKPTHGPRTGRPFRTAAECIDFSLPVPSIFLTKRQAKAWGKAQGVPAPKRPLALATQRRIARGIQRFVLDAPEPFMVSNLTNNVPKPVTEPLSTLLTGNHKYLVQPTLVPFLAGVGGRKGQSPETSVDRPYHTITAKGDTVLVVPTLINTRNGERHGKHGEQAPRVYDIEQPYPTITAQGSQGALVQASLIPFLTEHANASTPRVFAADEPLRTICATPKGGHFALVAAFLAKHNGGHEATGQPLTRSTDTVVCRENKALVTSHLLKLKGTCRDGQPLTEPMHTVQAQGNHYAEVRAFLVKFYGTKKDGRPLDAPLDTVTTKERFGLVTVTIAGEEYVVVDIGMRMLTPRELFRCQGFPESYRIDCDVTLDNGQRKRLTKKAQTRLCGNSVPPDLAKAVVAANMTERVEAVA